MPSLRYKGVLGLLAAAMLAGAMIASSWLATSSTASSTTGRRTAPAISIRDAAPKPGNVPAPSAIQTSSRIDFARNDKST